MIIEQEEIFVEQTFIGSDCTSKQLTSRRIEEFLV